MKSSEEFKAFYEASLLPILKSLEIDRKKIIRKMRPFLFIFILFALPAIAAIVLIVNDEQGEFVALVSFVGYSGSILTGLIYWLSYRFYFVKKINALKAKFKTEVVSQMVKFVDASLSYNPHGGISQAEYQQSQLFLTQVDSYGCEDLVSGKLGSTVIRFSEVHSQKKEERSNGKGGTTTTWVTIFKGIIFVADFNKNFSGNTIVVPDLAENLLGSFGSMFQKLNKSRGQLIKMEDVEFEKAFAVYGTDSVEAHYLLSPALMKRVMDFRKKSGKIYFSFINSSIFIAIPVRVGLNLFEPKIYSSLIDYKRIVEYNKYLMLGSGIVEDLNLNTRIWTKE